MKLLGHSPKFQGMARIVLIETLGTVGNEISNTRRSPRRDAKAYEDDFIKA